MGIKSLCKFLTKSVFFFSVFALAILLLPNLPPDAPIQESYKLAPNRPLEGKLAVNERLNKAELWHNGDLIGAESFAEYNGELYTGLNTGEIVKLTGQHITKIVKTGQPCRGAFEERICGRPLGMEFDKNGALYVADAYYGIMKINVKTGKKQILVSPDQKIGGKQPKVFNGLTLASNGDIFWTDSSANFFGNDMIFDALADPSGRLIHYNAKTKQNTVIMDKIAFANGVLLTPDESAVLVSESFKNRILRFHLKGAKMGQQDILVDGLPGMPDNLRHDGTGNGFLVTFFMSIDEEHPFFIQQLGAFPKIRKFLARLMGLNQMVFETIDRFYPNDFSLKAVHFIGHFTSIAPLLPRSDRATIAHIANNGKILDTVHAIKHIHSLSEAYIWKDTLYMGTPYEEYIGRVKLADIGWQHLIQKVPSSSAPPRQETTTQKPTTTTTPRPATTTAALTPKQTQPTLKPTTAPPPVKKQAPPPEQRQTPPPAQKQTAPPTKQQSLPAQKQAPTAPAQKQAPPPPAQKQAPPPPQKQAPPQAAQKQSPPPPAQKQSPPPTAQKQSPPSPAQKQPPPPTQQVTPPAQKQPPPPPAPKQTPPPQQQQPKQAPPAAQNQTPPPPAQRQTPPPPAPTQTPPPQQQQQKQAPPAAQKQTPPPAAQKQTPPPPAPKQTPPPQQQQRQAPPAAQNQIPPPPAPKQTPPPQQQQQKQAPPAAQKQTPPPAAQKQTPPPPAPKQTPPPQQQPKQAPPAQNQAPPPVQKQATPPPPRQPNKEQPAAAAKLLPVKQPVETK